MVDIRWIQRFSNYKKALKNLEDAVELMREKELSFLEKQGSVQAFEYTYELAWKVLKDFLASRGKTGMYGPKDIAKKALALELIDDGEVWMQMIKSRKLTSQTYDENTANEIIEMVKDLYYGQFEKLKLKMEEKEKEERKGI